MEILKKIAELMAEGKTEEAEKLLKEHDEATAKPLVSKRDELLGKLKEKNDKLTEAEQIAKDAAEAKAKAEEEAILKSGDVDKIKTQLEEKYTKQLQERDEKLAGKDSQLNKLLVDNGLNDALTQAKVAPQYMDAVKALIKANNTTEIVELDGSPVAQIGGKPIKDYVTEWTQGDQGKHYLAAPQNGGGGSNGANGGGKAPSGKKADMSVKEKTAYIREHGQEAYTKLD